MPAELRIIKLWDATTDRFVSLPAEPQINSSAGAAHYLQKQIGGRRCFYLPQEVEPLSPEQRKALHVGNANASGVVEREEGHRLVEKVMASTPAEREAILRALGVVSPQPAQQKDAAGGRGK